LGAVLDQRHYHIGGSLFEISYLEIGLSYPERDIKPL